MLNATPIDVTNRQDWVDDAMIPEALAAEARAHVEALRLRLELDPIRVRWFGFGPAGLDLEALMADRDEAELRFRGGFTSPDEPGTIGLFDGLSGYQLAWTIAHEIGHIIEIAEGYPPNEGACDAIADAYVRGDL